MNVKKILLTISLMVLSTFLFSSITYAGKQELTKDNVQKAWAKSATQADFCKLNTSADDIKAFSDSLLVGGNSDEDKFLSNIGNLPCTKDMKKIIYGILQVQRVGMKAPDESLEQLFIIDDVIVRPIQYYNDYYKQGEFDLNTSSNSVYGAIKGIRSTHASLSSPVEGTGLDAGYYAHLDQTGTIDGLYVLYKNDLFRSTKIQKEINDLILVDYTADTKKSEAPSVDETANWKTYTSSDNVYSLKYPSDKFVQLHCSEIESKYFYLVPRDATEKKDVIEVATECARDSRYTIELTVSNTEPKYPASSEYYAVEEKSLLIDGIPAKQLTSSLIGNPNGPYPTWYEDVYFSKNNIYYQIHLGKKDFLSTFDQILSTFKFTQ